MKRLAAQFSILFFTLASLFTAPVAISSPSGAEEKKPQHELVHSGESTYLTPHGQTGDMYGIRYDSRNVSSVFNKKSPVLISVAGGLVVITVKGASGVVATITAGMAAYKAFDFLDSAGSRIEDARELAEILSDNKEKAAKYAKMSYDTLYSLCHDRGGGMMSVKDVKNVKEEMKKVRGEVIFGVPEENAVCVAN